MNVVLMFYTFGQIEQMEKTALIQSPKTETSFDVKLIQGNRSSTNNYELRITTKFENIIELTRSRAMCDILFSDI